MNKKHPAIPLLILIIIALAALTGCPTLQLESYDTSGASLRLPVAMVGMECDLDPEINRSRMRDYILQIMSERPDVRLIGFGETALGWYWKGLSSGAYHKSIAEPLDGETVTLMRDLAAQHGVNISFGFTEAAGGKIYNTALIIDDTGEIIAHRRKSDFVPYDSITGFTAGEKVVTTAYIDSIKAAFLICNDFNNKKFQEEIMADPEIKMLILPHATAGLKHDFYLRYPYNYEGLWFLAAQRYGDENGMKYYGAWVLDPNGNMVIYSENGPGYVYYEVMVD